ncbi:MAG: HXXEE domain-containing protein [Actinobacteria bacterium]|nr:HXXEE domain-containing protein [Actinomycetota bacterium]
MTVAGRVDTHGRWPWAAAALVGPTWGAAVVGRRALRRDDFWVAALGLPILVAHQTEEWVRPGGFLPFCNERLLRSDRPTWPLTERDGFHVNVTAGWGTAIAAALLWRRSAAPATVILWAEEGNAAMHTGMAVRERRYNPGLVTAIALMGVHAAAARRSLHRSGRLGRGEEMAAAAIGIGLSAGLPLTMKLRMRRAARRA